MAVSLLMALLMVSHVNAFRLHHQTRNHGNQVATRDSATYPMDVPVFIRSHRHEYLKDAEGMLKLGETSDAWEQWVISDAGNGKVTIKSHRSQYLKDSSDRVKLSRNAQEWEQWTISDAGNGKFTIKSHRNQYLQDYNGQVKLTGKADEWEQWSILPVQGPTPVPTPEPTPATTPAPPALEPTPAPTPAPPGSDISKPGEDATPYPMDVPVFIQSHQHKYLKDEEGMVKLGGNSGAWEQWVISDAGNGTATIKSHRSQILQDSDGRVILSEDAQERGQWTISSAGDGKFIFKGHRNQHLQDYNGQVKLTDNANEWEQWSILPVQGPPGSACLCVFDIDRTLTGPQGDTTNCPDNKVLDGIHDPGYGWGSATLSQLTSVGIATTFCGECHLGIVSAGAGNGEGSAWNNYLLDEIMRSPPQDEFQAANPHAKRYSYGTRVHSPYVLNQGNRVKQHSVEGMRQWYGSQGIAIAPGDVYFFGDRTENMQPFSQYSINAREISCASRDYYWYGGSGIIGKCGARTEEIQRQQGQILCN